MRLAACPQVLVVDFLIKSGLFQQALEFNEVVISGGYA